MKKHIIISFCICLFAINANGQGRSKADRFTASDTAALVVDTTTVLPLKDTAFAAMKVQAADTLPPKKKIFEPNAKKAGMYSSILPGLGQTYNRQYWKVPVVYAILGTAGYFIAFNYNKYSDYRQAYIYAIDGDPGTNGKYPLYEAGDLQRLQNSYKKDLDVIVLLTSVGYALQIMDAVASAHLKNFDVSRDISMQVKPMVQSNFIGMGLVMNFK